MQWSDKRNLECKSTRSAPHCSGSDDDNVGPVPLASLRIESSISVSFFFVRFRCELSFDSNVVECCFCCGFTVNQRFRIWRPSLLLFEHRCFDSAVTCVDTTEDVRSTQKKTWCDIPIRSQDLHANNSIKVVGLTDGEIRKTIRQKD